MWLTRWLKEAQKFEEQITILKAVTGKTKGKKVKITEDQIDLLIACAVIGVTSKKEIYDAFGITNALEDENN